MATQSKKSSSGRKKTASSRKGKSSSSPKGSTRKNEGGDIDVILKEILYIVLILFFIILFIGNFVPHMVIFGPIGGFLRRMFGIGSYFVSILGIWYIVWELRHKDKRYKTVKLVGVGVLFFGLIIFAHILGGKDSGDFSAGQSLFKSLYKVGAASNGGGVGGIIACGMKEGLTAAVGVLVSLIIIVIGLILFTGKSFFKAMKALGGFLFASKEISDNRNKPKTVKKGKALDVDERQMGIDEIPHYKRSSLRDGADRENESVRPSYDEDKGFFRNKKRKMFNFIIEKDTPSAEEEAKKAEAYFDKKEKMLKNKGESPLEKDKGYEPMAPLTFDLNKSALVDNEIEEIIEEKEGAFELKEKEKDLENESLEEAGETEAAFVEDISDEGISREEPVENEDISESLQGSFYDEGQEPLIDVPLESSEEAKSAGVIASAMGNPSSQEYSRAVGVYAFPPMELLEENKEIKDLVSKEYMLETAKKLEDTLASFGVSAKVVQINRGPTVTRYEVSPGTGVKVSKIANLADDIALNLAASGVRIEAPIPGKAAVGIEIPNKKTSSVLLRDVLDTEDFKNASSKVSFGLGQDIAGNTIIPDISKMPHMLIAGATGSGKSVCINTIITSIIYKSTPEEVKLILIDPKMVELSVYNGIPHLMLPVVTDPKKAAGALNWGVREMLMRYQRFLDKKVRDIDGYNNYLDEHPQCMEEKMPRIVIIVDELADLMMVASNEVEDAIARLAQMARAAGLHLIIATQRPSVDVITGVIKANIPSRIAFSVSSGVDSRTIIDMVGAEKLIGKGDMLFSPMGLNKPMRVQGAFISDREVENVVQFVKDNSSREVLYDKRVMEEINSAGKNLSSDSEVADEFYEDALELVVEKKKASASMLQRQFKIGYNRAARLIEDLEAKGIVGPEEGSKPRKVLLTKEEYYNMKSREEDIEE